MSSWSDLKKPEKKKTGADEFDIACAQALSSPAGRDLLARLHAKYISHVPPGLPEDRALLVAHANRQLVRHINDATERGIEALTSKKKT